MGEKGEGVGERGKCGEDGKGKMRTAWEGGGKGRVSPKMKKQRIISFLNDAQS